MDQSSRRHLTLATLSFAICFAAWGLISAFAPQFRDELGLTQTQTGFLVAVPVLLGALARLPVGLLADRFGGRIVFTVLMLVAAVPVALTPAAASYPQLLVTALFLGLAGASFSVGVSYASRWAQPGEQGTALGIYGTGNLGQSAAVFLAPLLAGLVGRDAVFHGMAALLAAWGLVFAVAARDAVPRTPPATFAVALGILRRERLAWALSAFYFLTFGGFVAFSIYLPVLLRDTFGFTAGDAGFRTAGFVVLATALRPVGGWLADRIGGARVLRGVFYGVVPFALLLAWPSIIPFTVGALGCAALLGLGNGAVFKLVPQYFPGATGTVTGLVGAMGGLGGFFPPLLLGFFKDQLGVVWPGYVLLAATAAALGVLNTRVFLRDQERLDLQVPADLRRTADLLRAGTWATLWTGLLVAAIFVGSRNLQNFDPALVIYTFAVVFATWGVVFHYTVWLDKPPTRVYWQRGFELVRQRGYVKSALRLGQFAASHLVAQRFIAERSRLRWLMHQLLFWGCLLAVAITFPLVFGWVHFGSAADDQMTYVTYVFGFPVASFPLKTALAWLIFHGLDVSAVLVLSGIALSLWRRMRDKGAQAVQSFSNDFLPLVLLFAISVTGLALTVSTMWLRGSFYGFLSILHAITVITALLYLPFGKFFHIFQRPAQLGVKLYQDAGAEGPQALCVRCGEAFASLMHVEDLRRVLPELGFDYRTPGPAGHWQALCPRCKRVSLASAQLRMKEEARG